MTVKERKTKEQYMIEILQRTTMEGQYCTGLVKDRNGQERNQIKNEIRQNRSKLRNEQDRAVWNRKVYETMERQKETGTERVINDEAKKAKNTYMKNVLKERT